ncbi:ATP-binding cassette domain-containing protein [Streptomyces sp. E11-3]|uniref:ATP-binding cassette domain-containing protein n=1 Tax=Streptomyces sp. E11-3 TaxID=3110112 RepID=UPI00397FD155
MTSRQQAINVTGLRKSYGDKLVLDGIDLLVPAGTIYSLLGPNGAGKTTAVQILSTLITADAGGLRVGGHDLAENPAGVRAAIGVTGQFSAVDNLITGEENMLLMADLHHLSRREGRRIAAELLERFDLADAAKKPASTYSGGMRRRAARHAVPPHEPRLRTGESRDMVATPAVPGTVGGTPQHHRTVDLLLPEGEPIAGGRAGDDIHAQLGTSPRNQNPQRVHRIPRLLIGPEPLHQLRGTAPHPQIAREQCEQPPEPGSGDLPPVVGHA